MTPKTKSDMPNSSTLDSQTDRQADRQAGPETITASVEA